MKGTAYRGRSRYSLPISGPPTSLGRRTCRGQQLALAAVLALDDLDGASP